MLRRDVGIGAKLDCVKFYFTAYGVRSLLATLPRSGYNYATLVLNTAWDMAQGGTGEYTYQGGKWKTRFRFQSPLDWRTPLEFSGRRDVGGPVIFHTHLPFRRLSSFPKNSMRVVVLVRNIFDQLESEMFHEGYDASSQDRYLVEGAVDRSIEFYNSWGAFVRRHEGSRILRYEELIREPFEAIRSLSEFWDLGLPADCIRAAVQQCRRSEMLKRIPPEEWTTNPRVSAVSRRGIFSPANQHYIERRITDKLRYSMGYDYHRAQGCETRRGSRNPNLTEVE